MIEILLVILFIGLFCNGVKIITEADSGHILSFLGKWYDNLVIRRTKSYFDRFGLDKAKVYKNGKKKPPWNIDTQHSYAHRFAPLFNPIFGCVGCMAGLWGSVIFHIRIGITIDTLPTLLFVVVASVAVNIFIYNKLNP